jgi:hypothetical protein
VKELFFQWKHFIEENSVLSDAGTILQVREKIKDALRYQVPSKEQEFLISQLDNRDIAVRYSAANMLKVLPNLSPTSLQVLGDRMEVVESIIRQSLIECFGNRRTLPQNLTQVLLEELKDQSHERAKKSCGCAGKRDSTPRNAH